MILVDLMDINEELRKEARKITKEKIGFYTHFIIYLA